MSGFSEILEARRTRLAATEEELRARRAELAVLVAYDLDRSTRGHDYGGGQRYQEIVRRERELGPGLGAREPFEPITLEEKRAAFERVGAPRLRRLERDAFGTESSNRSIRSWRLLRTVLFSDSVTTIDISTGRNR